MEDLKNENHGPGMSLKELLLQKGIVQSDFEAFHKKIRELTLKNENLEKENSRLKQEIETLKIKKENSRKNNLSANSLFNKAVDALKQDNPVDAMGFLQAVLILEPGNIKAMNNLAVVYFDLGYESRAFETLNAVLKKEPDNKTALKNLAVLEE